jgi:hypothetical protein
VQTELRKLLEPFKPDDVYNQDDLGMPSITLAKAREHALAHPQVFSLTKMDALSAWPIPCGAFVSAEPGLARQQIPS